MRVWDNFDAFLRSEQPDEVGLVLFTKNGERSFWDMPSMNRMYLVFGSETRGIPIKILKRYENQAYHIPTSRDIRSLNLSTAVGVALYESLRAFRPLHEW